MGLFRRREKTIDLTERYSRQKDRVENLKEGIKNAEASTTQTQGGFNFLTNLSSASSPAATYPDSLDSGESSDEKRKRLAKRLMDITEKIEDLSTQLYHLQQRVELLERKNKSGFE